MPIDICTACNLTHLPLPCSPEICANRKYSYKSDVWSAGVVLYELATLQRPFEAQNMRALIQKVPRRGAAGGMHHSSRGLPAADPG